MLERRWIRSGILTFFNASLSNGIDIVLKETQFLQSIKDADLVITGEGKIDVQTIYGKTPIGVAKATKQFDLPVIGICGSLGKIIKPYINMELILCLAL